ncbi:DUF3270 family protein [Streptococcus sp. zg-JUN1979]|uniref:DUF3270 family protein n=1 Tax=Streptococcus sp. zg-JUN1979 TaxID=3391450 RepID=UPI0039A6BADD
MPVPIKHEQELEDQQVTQLHANPKSKAFHAIDTNLNKYKDLIFFAQLSGFAISTVFIAFLLLTFSLTPFWAFTLALVASFGLRLGIIALIKARH